MTVTLQRYCYLPARPSRLVIQTNAYPEIHFPGLHFAKIVNLNKLALSGSITIIMFSSFLAHCIRSRLQRLAPGPGDVLVVVVKTG
jgi:hypothetical protein